MAQRVKAIRVACGLDKPVNQSHVLSRSFDLRGIQATTATFSEKIAGNDAEKSGRRWSSVPVIDEKLAS